MPSALVSDKGTATPAAAAPESIGRRSDSKGRSLYMRQISSRPLHFLRMLVEHTNGGAAQSSPQGTISALFSAKEEALQPAQEGEESLNQDARRVAPEIGNR